jgi:hypothetical protein
MRSYAHAAMENIPLWHERDISHSSVERVIAPDATIALDFMLRRMNYVLGNLCVYPENMQRNLAKSGGAVFSEKVLLALVDKGLARDVAYRMVQAHALKAGKGRRRFKARASCGRRDAPLFVGSRDRQFMGYQAPSWRTSMSFSVASFAEWPRLENKTMRVRIFVSLKKGVLDPQGKAIERSLHAFGYAEVQDVRVGQIPRARSGCDLARERRGAGSGNVRQAARESCHRRLPL